MSFIVKNSHDNIKEVVLFGVIDEWIYDQVIDFFKECRDDKVRIKINSLGGFVFAGYGVVTEMNMYKERGGTIEVINCGVAYSTAGWIFMAGSKGHRKMYNYSTVLIHDISFGGEEAGEDDATQKIRNGIIKIISANTNLSEDQAREYMKGDNVFDHNESKNLGITDEILESPNSKNILSKLQNCTPTEALNITSEIYNKSYNNMNKLRELLNIDKSSTDDRVAEVMNERLLDLEKQTKEVERLKSVNNQLNETIKEFNKIRVDEFVEQLKNDGVIQDDKAQEVRELCETLGGVENAKKFYSTIKVTKNLGSLNNEIEPTGNSDSEFDKAKKFMNGEDKSDEAQNFFYKHMNSTEFKNFLKK